MKIVIIGSSQYRDKFKEHARDMKKKRHEVSIPAFDDHKDIEVHVIWDNRSEFGATGSYGKNFYEE